MTNSIWGNLLIAWQSLSGFTTNTNPAQPPPSNPAPTPLSLPDWPDLLSGPSWNSVTVPWSPPWPWKHYSFGHPGFAPEWGRVTRGFDAEQSKREWQAEQILRRFGQWPPPEGEVYVVQIDQDSPPSIPKFPTPGKTPEESRARVEAYKKAVTDLNGFLTSFSGQTSVFRAQRVNGALRLVELLPAGPLRSASHPGQIDPAGQASCNAGVCGMAWLRNGIYPYSAASSGVFSPVQDSLMAVARDVDYNGAIDHEDSVKSARAYGFAIQIHPGFPQGPRSVGCQTFPPDAFPILEKAIKDSGVSTFSYVLVRRPNEVFGARPW